MSLPKVAIIGTNGSLGKPVLSQLSTSFKDSLQLPIIAFTHSKPTHADTEEIKWVQVEFSESNLEDLYAKFTGIDVIIELVGPNAEFQAIIEKVAAKIRPKLYLPSQFGAELDKIDFFPGIGDSKLKHLARLRAQNLKVVDVACGFFSEPHSYLIDVDDHVFGLDLNSKTVYYRGDPDAAFAFSSLNDIGRVIGTIVTKKDPQSIPDKVRFFSQLITPRMVKERYESVHGVQLTEVFSSSEESLRVATKRYNTKFESKDYLYYLSVALAQGVDKGLSFSWHSRDYLNPGERNWKWEKY